MSMVEVKVAELSGAALDWAVADALGFEPTNRNELFRLGGFGLKNPPDWHPISGLFFSPSKNWSQGGPLIGEYAIGFLGHDADNWLAFSSPCDVTHQGIGPTHLIAACRMIVAAKMGETMQVPEELMR